MMADYGALIALESGNPFITPQSIVNITAYAGCRFNGSSTRINAAPSTTATGSAAGGTTTGIALTAINTAAYD
ncbi:hypothetical protein OQ482_11925 [Enterobacter bugandensis]|uniref:hypothetical protein n=1 Tax=Enterobacter bugandensis TaxID=881260 RepID=UPI00283A8EB7|nr:hypothetical protein [Enterobacter bugandensis]WMU40753.1 hypothetical protein OQ482_11925 [Enterobacter bugandensis]